MTDKQILAMVDHTLLRADASWMDIKTLCDEAIENQTASICINPSWVKPSLQYLKGRVPICTVIGFPLGATTTDAKVYEAEIAAKDGADEFDMVINIGRLRDEDMTYVQHDIAAVKKAIGSRILKVIIETCLLSCEEKEKMCSIVPNAGADYIKTSTGFSASGATFEDIELFAHYTNGRCKIKAAGGIRTRDDMLKFIQLGAARLGTSSAIKILKGEQSKGY